ncbi:pre-peptidase C-terminal domain-containing protein [Dactylococcopsis salina]|uniref:Ca2+-binding protein, RTX toxin n=1 Tax=Dactylococcopsis salina (strain PCC 8305) TaxID=13035 RepID=K9YWZ6_DACS8|nr:pre-peptidase C-terminal domain-containing protein [Dactylococcopsis salina]AFZ50840.1 Ca2+-binding protein, RTX toxin [Dactylococcopsis salina PCC 8305]
MATINGSENNDRLNGTPEDDLIVGGAGNDELSGGAGDDTFQFGEVRQFGLDVIAPSNLTEPGSDTIRFLEDITPEQTRLIRSPRNSDRLTIKVEDIVSGSVVELGRITINNQYSPLTNEVLPQVETLVFASDGSAVDLTQGLTITGNANSIEYLGTQGDDTLKGLAGDDTLRGFAGSDRLEGGENNDDLFGGEGNDTLIGGKGDDDLFGGKGNDTFLFDVSAGEFGTDRIVDDDDFRARLEPGTDEIRIQGEISEADLRFFRGENWNQLNIFVGEFGQISIDNQYSSLTEEPLPQVENLVLENAGKTIDLTAGLNFTGTEEGDSMSGTPSDDTLSGLAGSDTLSGLGGNDRLEGAEGSDTLRGGEGNDTLIGGLGDDDLFGGAGDDTFVFDVSAGGFGFDEIARSGSLEPGTDEILIQGEISESDLRFFREENSNQLNIFVGEFGQIRIENQYSSLTEEPLPQVENLVLENAETTIDLTGGLTFVGNENRNNMSGSPSDDTLSGLAGSETLSGLGGNDRLEGSEGSDALRGGKGNDTLIGGKGDDDLFGGEGDDTFVFDVSAGEFGLDEIARSGSLEPGTDEILIQGEISESDLRFFRGENSNQLNIFVGEFGQIEIENQYSSLTGEPFPQVEKLVLENAETTIDLTAGLNFTGTEEGESMSGSPSDDTLSGLAGSDTLSGLGGNDRLEGAEGSDTLRGGKGNDILIGAEGDDDLFGGEGDDTFEFAIGNFGGFGFNEISRDGALEAGNDTIRLLADVNPAETRFFRDGSSLKIFVERVVIGETVIFGQIKIENQYSNFTDQTLPQVETLVFEADDTNVDLTGGLTFTGDNNSNGIEGTANGDVLEGLLGNDELFGLAGDDVLIGGPGDDDLYGGSGSDIFSGTLGQLDGSQIFDLEEADQIRFEGASFTQDNLSRENFSESVRLTIDADNDGVIDTTIDLESEFADDDQLQVGTDEAGNTIIQLNRSQQPAPPQNLTLTGDESNNTLIGEGGNDIIVGGAGNDRLFGGAGDDRFEFAVGDTGFGSNVIADDNALEPGSDTIRFREDITPEQTHLIRSNNDLLIIVETVVSGSVIELGRITIENQYSPVTNEVLPQVETLLFASDVDATVDLTQGLTITGNATSGEIPGTLGNDSIEGLAGSDTLRGFAGNDRLEAGEGNDTLRGGQGNDTLIGGKGDDDLFGGEGNDTFLFDVSAGGFGFDEIARSGSLEPRTDEIRIQGEISEADLRFFRGENWNQLNIFVGEFGQIEIENQYSSLTGEPLPQVENLVLENAETTIDLTAGLNFTGTEEGDSMSGTPSDDTLSGLAGSDTLSGLGGNDRLEGAEGSDTLRGGEGNDTLIGGLGDDDLFGGAGDDTFVFDVSAGGFGFDEIARSGSLEPGTDEIRIQGDISEADLRFFRGENSNQLNIFVGEFGQIEIENQYSSLTGEPFPQVENLVLENAETTIDLTAGLNFTGTEDGNSMSGSPSDDTLSGLAGSDTLSGLGGNDRLEGAEGSDTLRGGEGNDTLFGGLGDDDLFGGAGDDTFVFDVSAGEFGFDEIARSGSLEPGTDEIIIQGEISENDLRFFRQENSNQLNILVGEFGQIRIENQYSSLTEEPLPQVENLVLENAETTIDLTAGLNFTGTEEGESMSGSPSDDTLSGLAGSDTLSGLGGNDRLEGAEGSDTLRGGEGNDTLIGAEGDDDLFGGEGDDTFEFAVGDAGGFGFDEIGRDGALEAGNDTIRLLADVNPAETRFFRDGSSLKIFVETLTGGETIPLGQINIYNQYSNLTNEPLPQVETLVFEADDTTIDLTDGLTFTGDDNGNNIEGTANGDRLEGLFGDDALFGFGGDDVLVGGPGSNDLRGGAGNDIFLGTLGQLDGDQIFDFEIGDQIRFQNTNFTQSSLSREDFENSVRLTIDADNDQVIDTTIDLEGQFTDTDRFEVQTDEEGNTNILLVDRSNATPAVENPVDDITLEQGDTPGAINLFDVFEDKEEEDAALTYRVANTNPSLVETNFNPETGELTLILSSGVGSSDLILEASDSRGFTGSERFTLTKAGSEQEPNDIISQATNIGASLADAGEFATSGFIGDNTALDNPRLDTDLYQVGLNSGESIQIDVDTNAEVPLDTIIRVFNTSGRELGFNDDRAVAGESSSDDPSLTFTAPNSGNFYIGISNAANDRYSPFFAESGLGGGVTGTYQLTVTQNQQPQPVQENAESPVNDTLDNATSLELGEAAIAQTGEIGDNPDFITVPGLDVDLYQVELAEAQTVSFSITRASVDALLRVFDSNGAEIAFNDDLGDQESFIEFEAPTAGTYYIGVSGFGNRNYDPNTAGSGNNPFADTGSYTLNVTPEMEQEVTEPGPGEVDDTLEKATIVESDSLTATRSIGDNPDLSEVGLDVDLYQVELDSTSRLRAAINTTNLDSEFDSLLRIFDEDGNEVAINDDAPSFASQTGEGTVRDSFLTFTPIVAGKYYVGVSGFGNESYNPNQAESGAVGGSTGDYELQLTVTEAVPEEAPTNDTTDTAINVELTNNQFSSDGFIGDNFSNGGDVDLYQVVLEAEETLTIDVDAAILGSELDGFLRIFNSAGEEITVDDDSGDFTDPQLSFTAPTNDTYTVGLSAFANRNYKPITGEDASGGTTGEYEISFTVETPIPAAEAPVQEIRPTANDNTGFTNSNNTITIDVLNNDTANDDQGFLEITDFPETTEKGGTVTLDDQSRIVYTPDPDFGGVDEFTYTIANESGGFDEGTVKVTVNRPPEGASVQVDLEVLPVPGLEAQLDNGLQIGDEFLVNVRFFDQLSDNNPTDAVVAGYADLLFDPAVLQVVEDNSDVDGEDGRLDGVVRNAEYNVFRKGTVDNPQGLVNEVGGTALVLSPDSLPNDNGIFSLHLKAVGGGNTAILASRAADENSSTVNIIGALADQRNQTNFGEIDLAAAVSDNNEVPSAFAPNFNLASPNNAVIEEDVTAIQGAIDAMEINVNFRDTDGNVLDNVEVGQEFEIVLSARDLRLNGGELGNKLGVFSAFADVLYDTLLIDVETADLTDPFRSPVINIEDAINDGEGIVNDLGGTNFDLTPVTETQEFAVLQATAKSAGELTIRTNTGDDPTAINTLFGVDGNLNSGTIYGENTLTITGEQPEANADLVVTGFDAVTDHVLGGETEVNVTVENQGEGSASGFQLEVLYYQADNPDELATETPTVLKTLALDELLAGESTEATENISLPLDILLEEALADDPSVFGEEETAFTSNNIDYLGVRIVDNLFSNENEEAFSNNGVTGTKGVDVDDIAYFPWDIANNQVDGLIQGGDDELNTDGEVTPTDATILFNNIGQTITDETTETSEGLDLTRLDLDLDGAISPVDAVRVANRIGYEINPTVFEDAV